MRITAKSTGSDKLSKALAKIANALGNKAALRVGFLENAKYPDGTHVAMVAAIHNFGKWPFFSTVLEEKGPKWPDELAKALAASNFDANIALHYMGELILGQIKQQIRDTHSPPLAPSTIARKGFDKPLIDTAHMLNSGGYEIKMR